MRSSISDRSGSSTYLEWAYGDDESGNSRSSSSSIPLLPIATKYPVDIESHQKAETSEYLPHNSGSRSSSPLSFQEADRPQENIPIDWLALLPFLLLRIIDAITFTLIFPFIIEYITSLDAPPDKIGLYAGVAEGSMMFAEAIGSPFWSILADRFGRKRSFVWGFGVAVLAVGMIGFGRGVWWIVLWRFVYGLNPTPVLSRIYITELSHPTNREFIFSIYSPIFNFGHLLGLLLGSWLSNPYGRLPIWMGGESKFLKEWPYALPCVVNAGLGLVGMIVGQMTLIETRTPLPDVRTEKEISWNPPRNLWRATLRIPHFVLILSGFCAFQFATFAFENFFTIFIYTSIPQGGLGFPVHMTGTITSISTLMYMIASPFLIPYLRKQLSTRRALMLVVGVLPLLALLIPIAQCAATMGRMWVWLVLVIILPLKSVQQMGWPMNDHLNASCFDRYPELLSTGSAITLIAACSGRAFGPSIAGWLFSIATEFDTGSLGRQISWLSLFVLVLPPAILARRLPERIQQERRNRYDQLRAEDG